MGDATSSPGRTRAAASGTMDPARSDHGQRHKGQDAALARRKARGVTLHAQTIPAWSNPGSALSARHPPRFRGRQKRGMRATPWPKAANRGRFLLPQKPPSAVIPAERSERRDPVSTFADVSFWWIAR